MEKEDEVSLAEFVLGDTENVPEMLEKLANSIILLTRMLAEGSKFPGLGALEKHAMSNLINRCFDAIEDNLKEAQRINQKNIEMLH